MEDRGFGMNESTASLPFRSRLAIAMIVTLFSGGVVIWFLMGAGILPRESDMVFFAVLAVIYGLAVVLSLRMTKTR